MNIIEVIEGGLFTTVQDLGRYGYQRYGVPVSGAMDQHALRISNLLVGNKENEATLEISLIGPRLSFLEDALVAIGGGNLQPMVGDQPFPMWQAVRIRKGSILSFKGTTDGVRSYLAMAGGIDVPVLMGSKSTYVGSALGGFNGRIIKAGDQLKGTPIPSSHFFEDAKLPDWYIPSYGHKHLLRVVVGLQDDLFTPKGIETFLSATYTVSTQSERVGYRLQGTPIQYKNRSDIISDGIPFGAVQVTGDGLPIILLADRGGIGGYAKIATVISSDISRVVQALPGDTVTFRAITVEEAHEIFSIQEQSVRELRELLQRGGSFPATKLRITVDGEPFAVASETGRPLSRLDRFTDQTQSSKEIVTATIDNETYTFEIEIEKPN